LQNKIKHFIICNFNYLLINIYYFCFFNELIKESFIDLENFVKLNNLSEINKNYFELRLFVWDNKNTNILYLSIYFSSSKKLQKLWTKFQLVKTFL
jgi:hypothetical protein